MGYIVVVFEKVFGVDKNLMYFVKDVGLVLVWLVVMYVVSNLMLNMLNWYWYFKMIFVVKKRFELVKKEKVVVFVGGKGIGNVVMGVMVGEK